ncbi:hypothetical protein QIS74_12779 [Colletotrichum tabaci]|uniref:Uncharacterized protein n=1 Tax=Colletotrichum tabaci TaxID=1209068 RepID=A0AAV9SVM3_9PEZI
MPCLPPRMMQNKPTSPAIPAPPPLPLLQALACRNFLVKMSELPAVGLGAWDAEDDMPYRSTPEDKAQL